MSLAKKLALALCLLLTGSLAAAPNGAERKQAARDYFTDVELINQHGEPMRLYSDLLQDKIVVIDAIFTTCKGICPVMSQKLAAVQERVGDRLGKDVHLISISIDPEYDTPEALRAYAERFGAKEGWYFLTGETANVEQALYKLGQWVEQKESHQAVIIVGNESTGLWKKAFGLAPAPEIVAIVESVLADEGA